MSESFYKGLECFTAGNSSRDLEVHLEAFGEEGKVLAFGQAFRERPVAGLEGREHHGFCMNPEEN